MSFIPIKHLTPTFRHGAILARVSRMWDFRGGKDDGELRHVDLVLVDQEGTPIYAEIAAAFADAKKPLLAEGGIYVFERFKVSYLKPKYNPFETKFMINITHLTIIKEYPAAPPDIPLYVYNLSSLSNVSSLAGEDKLFIDVIGLVTEVGEADLRKLKKQPKPTRRRQVTIMDTKHNEAKIFLWGQRAIEFDADEICAMSEKKPVVIIFVGLLEKSYADGSFSGNSSCRWYVNPDVPEVHMFVNALRREPKPIVRLPPAPDYIPEVEDRPQAELKTLAEIKATNPYDFPPEGFRCTVILTKYNAEQGWHFPSCNKCSKTSLPYGSEYRCPRDNCTGYKFKYKPCYTATDGTADVELVFFDDVGRSLIGKDVTHLMKLSRNSGPVPSDIAAQVGQKYQFIVNVTSKAFERIDYSYEVRAIEDAYGRQPAIPRTQPPPVPVSTLPGSTDCPPKDKPHDEDTPPSASQISKHQDTSDLPSVTSDIPLEEQAKDVLTPPPPVSPARTPGTLAAQLRTDAQKTSKDIPARKRLALKDHEPTDDETHYSDPSAQDADDENSNRSEYVGDSDKPPYGRSKKPLPTKKAKKN